MEGIIAPKVPLKPVLLYVGVSGLPGQPLHGANIVDERYCMRIGWNMQEGSL